MYTSNLHAKTSRPCPIQSQSLKPATNYRNLNPTRQRTEQVEGIMEKREFKECKFLLQAFAQARHRVQRECTGRAGFKSSLSFAIRPNTSIMRLLVRGICSCALVL